MKTTCAHPVSMWELIGKKKPNGKAVILQAIPAPGTPAIMLLRDCGHCTGCRVRRRMDLSLRLQHEADLYPENCVWFVTLTYEDEHLPEHGSLRADDITLFVNKLRQQAVHKKTKTKIRFFGIGEYGGTMGRAHYHVILFGPDLADREKYYSRPDKRFHSPEFLRMFGRSEFNYYKSAMLEKAWDKKGHVQATNVSAAAMAYVSKFHIEKLTGEMAKHAYEIVDQWGEPHPIEPENARMSRNPGLGRGWIEKYWQDVYPKGYLVLEGKKCVPPKYYDRWLEKNHPEVYEQLKIERQKNVDMEMYLDDRRQAVDTCRNAQIKLNKELTG